MAKRRKPRPAGPPPAKSPKMERVASGTEPTREARLAPGEPRPPSFRGVLVRAVVISLLYTALLIFGLKESALTGAVVGVFGFALMIPLGMLMDRMRYRAQMKRWRAQRGIPEPVKAVEETTSES